MLDRWTWGKETFKPKIVEINKLFIDVDIGYVSYELKTSSFLAMFKN